MHNQRVEFIAFDFFKDAPQSGCDFYYVSFDFWPMNYPFCLTLRFQIRHVLYAIHFFVFVTKSWDILIQAQLAQL